MRLFAGRFEVAVALIALLAAGCSTRPASVTSPAAGGDGLAPLLGPGAGGRGVQGSYIVVFKPGLMRPNQVDALVDELSARHGFLASFRYRHALRGFAGRLTPAAVARLRGDPRVAYVEEDQPVHADVVQSAAPWGLDRIDQTDLPLSTTYTYTRTGAGVDAYVIDTGIRFTHAEFGGRAVAGIDEVTPGGTAADQHGHGTHVAGTIGGATFGVAKSVRLIAVRVLDANGSGTIAGVTAGVDWVTADHTSRPAVANMSLGGGLSPTLDNAVRASIADGIVYCIAAGNSGANASTASPADVAEALTVAASTSSDQFAVFSNFGSGVDLIAPGVAITSAWSTADNATATISGTSMATPHVAGAAALFLEANPTASPAAVAAALTASATASRIAFVPSGTPNRMLFTTLGAAPPPGPPPPPPPPP
ncbi:MAG TPA: S8 family peptidase, partial [Candidatus Eisenbacteria bacterium]